MYIKLYTILLSEWPWISGFCFHYLEEFFDTHTQITCRPRKHSRRSVVSPRSSVRIDLFPSGLDWEPVTLFGKSFVLYASASCFVALSLSLFPGSIRKDVSFTFEYSTTIFTTFIHTQIPFFTHTHSLCLRLLYTILYNRRFLKRKSETNLPSP